MSDSKITISPRYAELLGDIETLRAELLTLFLEHDELTFHTCRDLKTAYMLKFGALEYKVYEWQCKVLRMKRKVELVRIQMNKNEPVDIAAIDAQLDIEYAEYMNNLDKMMDDINEALRREKGGKLSKEETAEIKKHYRAIVLRLHPDVNPDITEWERQLFENAVTAYKNAELDALRSIFLLMDTEKRDNAETRDTMKQLTERKRKLEEQINSVQDKISVIKKSFPYDKKTLLSDKSLILEYTGKLNNLISDYQKAHKMYESQLREITG
jgi:hypothetical protein